jgi:hypothetical protein
MIEIGTHEVVEKIDLLAHLGRYSLVLRKFECPVGCAEWMPVSKPFWDHCEQGDYVQIRITRVTRNEKWFDTDYEFD